MKDVSDWSVPKWPFLLANVLLLGVAALVVDKAAHPISDLQILLVTGSVALGALLGILPFVLEYRGASKLIEVNALTSVAEQLHNLEKYSSQVAAATDQWANLHESSQAGAAKTAAAAREIADRMTNEVRNFNEFQAKLNDHDKQMLKLEVEKLRRIEGDWLQALARILDNIYSLYIAAVRSGQPEIAAQIGQFQSACRDATRRVGLNAFVGEADEVFDGQRHRAHGVENVPEGACIAETLALGLQFQGRLIRPALVRLKPEGQPVAEPTPAPAPEPAAESVPVATPPVAEPTPEPTPEAAPVAVEEPVTEVVEKPVEQPVVAPVETPVVEPVAVVAEEPVVASAPVTTPAAVPAEETVVAPPSEPAPAAAVEPVLPVVAETVSAPVEKPVEAKLLETVEPRLSRRAARANRHKQANPVMPASEPTPAPAPAPAEPAKPVIAPVVKDLFGLE